MEESMNTAHSAQALTVLPPIFHKLTDPRDPRGVRHPYAALCSLVFLGMLAQIVEMAVLIRWTKNHWKLLKEPLGFTRKHRPVPPVSHVLSPNSHSKNFGNTSLNGSCHCSKTNLFFAAAVDGKTCEQGLDENGNPEVLINVFLQNLKLALAGLSDGDLCGLS